MKCKLVGCEKESYYDYEGYCKEHFEIFDRVREFQNKLEETNEQE